MAMVDSYLPISAVPPVGPSDPLWITYHSAKTAPIDTALKRGLKCKVLILKDYITAQHLSNLA
jgi:hypothetical protein